MISCDTAQGAWGCIAWPARLWLAVLMCCWLLSTGASADAATCTPPVSGLVGWWPGDSNANDIASSNNGVLQPGAMAGAPGLVGLAFSFDGTNGYVQIPDAPALRPTNLTIEGWVRFNSLDSAGSGGSPAGEQYLVFRQNSNSGNFEGFDLGKDRVGASDYFRFQVSSAAGQSVLILSTTVVSVGVWYHVAAVRTPTAIQLFINGQMENQAAVGFAQDYGAFPLYFGTSGQSYWDHKFSGSLDEIALYNRALSASEIAAIYNAGSAGKCRTPSIDSQPQSLALNPGMTAVFTTSATGLAPLSYQWRFNGAVISGATNPSYIITSVQPTNTGQYLVAVSNPFGAVTSAVAVLTVVTGGSGCASAPAGLVGWWAGDGNANDLYSTNNGSLVGGAVANAAGLAGLAFSFDGTNGYAQIPDSPALHPTNLTIEAWVRFTSMDTLSVGGSPAGEQYIIFKQNSQSANFEGFDLGKDRVGASDYFRFQITAASGQSVLLLAVTPITNGVWYHVAGVRGTNFAQIYVNGHLEAATNVTFAQDYGTLPLFFGTSGQSYWDHKFAGLLDEVSLYNRALSSSEISAIFAAGSAGKCKAPGIVSQPASVSVPVGGSFSLMAAATGLAPLSYQWQLNGGAVTGATSSTFSRTNVQVADGGSYVVTVTNSLGSATSTASVVNVLVPPVITGQPQSSTNVLGTSASFTVTVTGTSPLNYQWQGNGTNLPGATVTGLTLASVQPSDAGNYRAIVTNVAGATTSAVAVLTVLVPPAVTVPPQSRTNVAGTAASFSVTATGSAPLSYQWQFNGASLLGATNSTLNLGSVQPSDAGDYTVLVANLAGVATSAVAVLMVLVPPAVTVQPQSQTNVLGSTAVFSATVTGSAPLFYQWYANGISLPSGTATVLSITNVQTSDAGSHVLVVTNLAGAATSSVAGLTVLGPPGIVLQPASRTNVAGTTATFSASATGTAPLYYQWRFNGNDLPGATTTDLVITNVQASNAGNYSMVATNAAGAATSAVAVLTVLLPPLITSQPQNATNIAGTAANFSAVAAGSAPISYQWQFNNTDLPGTTGASLTIPGVQAADAGAYTMVATNLAGSVTSSIATLTVLFPPAVSSPPQSVTNIQGSTVTFGATVTGTPSFFYQWLFGGVALAGDTGANLVITNVQATNAGSYALAITNIAGSITSAPATLTVILPPLITSQPQSRSNVVGTTASYSVLASSLVPIGYQWQLNGSPLGGATDSNLVVTNVQVANAGNYAVVLTNLAGSVTSIIATLTVLIPPAFVSQPQSVTNIPGGSAAFSATATGTAPLAYQWQFNSQNVAGATGSTLALTNVQPADAGNYSLIATNLAGSATSAVATLSVIIPPSISAQPQSRTNVAGSLAAFSVTVSGGLPLAYQWQGNGTNIPGATDSSLNISNVQPADAQAYSVVVTNLAGSVTSSVAVLTVWLPPAITTQPQGRTNLAGTSVTFNTAANGTAPLSYQWQLNSVSLPGASSTSLTISNVQVSDAGNYSVVVTNIAGATTSSVAVLVLATPPVITSQPQSLTNIAGTTAAFSVLVNGTAPLSYGWSFNNAIIVGATNATLTVTNVQPANAGTYLVTITNAYGAVTSAPAALTVIVPPPACTPPASGMVGWWPAEGTAEDIFSTNDGILQGGTTATNAGVLGTAFSFDGVNSYVQINDSPLFHPANLTIEAWVRFTSLDSPAVGRSPPGEQYIVFKQNSRNNSFEGFDLGKYRVGNNDYFRFQVASSSGKEIMILSTTAVSTGVWYHVAGVRGANFLQIYVNGHLDTQTSVDFAQDYDVLPLYFGTSGQSTWDHKFSGLLDEVSLYNRALGSNEIFAIYAAGSSGKCRLPAIESQPRSLLTAVGSNASFSVFAIGAAPLAYQWRFNGVDLPGASGSVLTLTNVQTSSSGNYVVVVSNYLGWVTSSVATLSVLTPPSFTTQPANLTNLLGSTASFSAVAAGSTPLSYRWQQNGVFLTNSARVTGVASNTLSVTSIQAADAGSYAVVASNAVGVATSAPASLIVWVPPAIVNQPQSQTVVAGTNAILTITTSGTPAPAYQWQFNSAILPGATNSTLVLSNVQPAQAGDYFVTVTNAIGSATSAVAAITVLVPASIVTQPGSLVVVVGSAATFTAQAAGTAPLSLQWRFNGTNLTNGGRVLGANANTLVITNIQFADAGSYTMLVTNSVGSAVSSAATLTVATPPVIQSQPATVQVLVGTNAGFSVAVSGSAPFAYQWQRNGTNLIDGGNILGSSTSSLTLANLQTNDSAAFQVVVTNIAGAITSAPANLLVTTTPIPPAIVTQPSPQTIEVGNDAGLAAVVTGTLPLSYQWRKNGVNLPPAGNIFGINGAALTIQNAQTTDTGDYQLVVTNSGGVVTSSVARLAVNLSVKVSADSLVLVNSTSPRYSDFSHFIQPYLDNFGIPYTVADIATNVIGTNVGRYALIIVGHNQLDPSGLYLDSAGHHNIASAIAAGTGLVNFDSAGALAGRSPPYQFAQDIFGISYGSAATGSTVSYPATQPGGQMHYITSLHPTNETLVLSNNLTFSGLTLSNATVLAVSGGMPLVGVAQYGQGRAVQWGGYAWMSTTVHGPLNGLDDLVWRGCVWAARKPFVMRGLPNFVAMRVDDVEGPLRWVHIANEVGFKPFLALFMGNVSPTNIADLRSLITNGNATASIHSFTASTLFYFDHQNLTNYSDSVISNNFYIGAQWHQTNGIPMSRSMIPHYSEIGPNAFPLLSNLGIDFIALEVVPGTVEYGAHPAPWLMAGPYRLSDPPGQGQVNLPLFYADFMNVPGHPELAGRYFDRYTEIRNTAVPGAYECGEWCPDNNDIAGSINRATVQIKRALDSQVLASVFTHEWNIHPTTCCGSTTISDNNWRAILYGVTNNLAAYHPIYVTTDYADQYVRATRTSRLVSCQFDSSSGQLTTTFSGKTDLDLSVQIYQGADNLITNIAGTVPMFTGSSTSVVATLPTAPVIYSPPMASTNNAGATVSFQVGAGGAPPLRYRWFRNGTSALNDAGTIVGSANSTLTIGGVLGSDAGTYSVVVSNANGSVTSAPVVLAVNDPFLFSQPLSRTNHAGTDAAFTVGVNGTQPAYQWFKDGVPAAGATAKTLILPAVTPADAAGYNVLVSNIYGSLLSATASLSVSSPLFIQSLVVTDGSASVTWSAIPGRSYLLQSKETMTDPAWTSTVASLTATGSLATATNLLGNSTQRFYRVFLVP